jgi:WD40 repeat protein
VRPKKTKGDDERIVQIGFSAGGERLVTAIRSGSGKVQFQIWTVEDGQPVSKGFTVQTAPLSEVALSPDGRLAATASLTGFTPGSTAVLTVWNLADGRTVFEDRNVPTTISLVRFSPDSSRVAAATLGDGSARVWDWATGKETAHAPHHAPLLDLAFSADGRRLATSGGVAELHAPGAARRPSYSADAG